MTFPPVMVTTNQRTPTRSPHVSWSQFGDGLVLYNTMSKEYYVVEGAAALMWRLADGNTSPEAIARALTGEFVIAQEDALTDVGDTLEGLSEFGLLEWVS